MILGPPLTESARRRGFSLWQVGVLATLVAAITGIVWAWPDSLGTLARVSLAVGFLAAILLRVTALMLHKPMQAHGALAEPADLPHYTVMVALHDEAALVPQLFERLDALAYPRDRLKGFVIVEPCDPGTLAAALLAERPEWLDIVIAPPGGPMTKPRALNVGLSLAPDGLICVYDAEDWPDPDQLLEAAGRLSADDPHLACVQAPLRIRQSGHSWLARQFAAEYAALFEVVLPALARLGLPLPLGGTSNHFLTDVLRKLGGWDPWNVTEDADLGFRLARHGYRTATIDRPTYESPPASLRAWLPQRTRWLKGFMQTWGVHTRSLGGLTWRTALSLCLTIGLPIVSALLQAIVTVGLMAMGLVALLDGAPAPAPVLDLGLAAAGWLAGAACCWVGSRRAGQSYRVTDAMTAPIYWALTTLAAWQAACRLVTEPFYWDKTPHLPDVDVGAPTILRPDARMASS